jgi:CheY-like chemotaxis protein
MPAFSHDSPDDLILTRKDLYADVFALKENPHDYPPVPRELLENSPELDPEFARAIASGFAAKPSGKREALKMEIDILRRLKRCRETEQITRAYGAVNLVTPVKYKGRTVHAIISGPLKISQWTEQERATFAKLCGLHPSQLPAGLDKATVFRADQIESILLQQEQKAKLFEALLTSTSSTASQSTDPVSSPAILDLLQPGFADHLDVLFRTVQKEISAETTSLNDLSRVRIEQATRRGRHLVDEIRHLTHEHQQVKEWAPVHQMLEVWTQHLKERYPSLRFSHKLHAEQDRVHTRTHALNHLLYTLLSGVADGLPEATGMMGISTRDDVKNGRDCLHVEIRDGGGLATFAGVGRPLDQEILNEQNEEFEACSDWLALAQEIDAELKVLREDGTVSRIELWLYTDLAELPSEATSPAGPSVWVVEDDDREFRNLRHMLSEAEIRPVHLRSAQDLRDYYPVSEEPPSLVILKYLLPDERGSNLRTWLYEQDPDLPVILVSSFSGTHPGIATVSNLPSTLYLQKPYDSQALLDMLRMTIDDTLRGV